VNLTGAQPQMYIDAYAVQEWENDKKFHVFATKHKAKSRFPLQTYRSET
jgi:hypothetical protein